MRAFMLIAILLLSACGGGDPEEPERVGLDTPCQESREACR